MAAKKIIILGAAGKDFHLFNMVFRGDANYDVVAFTANQIPYISNRLYPPELSGKRYPKGIRIHDESELPELIKKYAPDACILAYSDLNDLDVMHKASLVNSKGSDFLLIAPQKTMLKSKKPVGRSLRGEDWSGKEPDEQIRG